VKDQSGPSKLCSPSECQLLIFDLDGTLIDSFVDIRRSLMVSFEAISIAWREELMELVYKGVSLDQFYENALGEKCNENPARFATMLAVYREDYSANSKNSPYPYAEELLRDLRKERPGMSLGIATTKPTSMAKFVLEDCQLASYFDVICGTDNEPHKPNPALLYKVCDNASTPVSRAMMVGDTDRDIGAAQSAPMTSVGICHGGFSREGLLSLAPEHIVEDLQELHKLFV